MDVVAQLLNFVYFLVGLAVGGAGLYLSVRFHLAQQQDKFDRISAELIGIRERLAALTEIVSERTSAREERLLSLITAGRIIHDESGGLARQIQRAVEERLEQVGTSNAAL